jgi:hypothetical protein
MFLPSVAGRAECARGQLLTAEPVNCLLLSPLNLLLTHGAPDAKMTQPLCEDVASLYP